MVSRTWVAELDRDTLRFTIAEGAAKRRQIVHTCSLALASDDASDLRAQLRAASAGFDLRGSEGFVLVSDRRFVHGEIALDRAPRRNNRDAQVLDTARDLGLWDEDVPIAASWHTYKRVGGGVRLVFDATQTSLVDSIVRAASSLGPEKLWLASLESAIARSFVPEDTESETTAVLDVRESHATFVLCRAGRVESSRRFQLPFPRSSGVGGDALLPLAMEVARSIEFLSDLGIDAPQRMLVSGSVEEEDFDAEAWTEAFGGLETNLVDNAFLSIVPECSGPAQALGAAAFLLASRRVPKLCWLHEPVLVSFAERSAGILGYVAASIGVLVGGFLVYDSRSEESRARLQQAAELESEILRLEDQSHVPPPAATDERRKTALAELDRDRFSASSFCAALSTERPDRIRLTRVTIDEVGDVSITGIVQRADRIEALKDFGSFNRRLASYLASRELGGSLAADAGEGDEGIAFEIHARKPSRPRGGQRR